MTHPSQEAQPNPGDIELLASRIDCLEEHPGDSVTAAYHLMQYAALLRSQQPVSGGERERCACIAAKWYRQCHMRMDIGGEAIAIRIGHEIDGAAFVASIEDKAIAAEAAKLIDNIAARLSAPQAVGCEWHADDDGTWYPGCDGEPWVFNDGGPAENRVEHCMRCGKPVTIAPPTQGDGNG
jgi:hypothetical protein